MLDEKRVQESMQNGLAFICASCKYWHLGVDVGMKDADGDAACMWHLECKSPIAGGSFDHYEGPMSGSLDKFCYVCGKIAERALVPQVFGAKRIGCCVECLENIVKKKAIQQPGKKVLFTTAKRAGPDKFEEIGS